MFYRVAARLTAMRVHSCQTTVAALLLRRSRTCLLMGRAEAPEWVHVSKVRVSEFGHQRALRTSENLVGSDGFQGTADVARNRHSGNEISRPVLSRLAMPTSTKSGSNVRSLTDRNGGIDPLQTFVVMPSSHSTRQRQTRRQCLSTELQPPAAMCTGATPVCGTPHLRADQAGRSSATFSSLGPGRRLKYALTAAITSGTAPNTIKTTSPGIRSHSMRCDRSLPM